MCTELVLHRVIEEGRKRCFLMSLIGDSGKGHGEGPHVTGGAIVTLAKVPAAAV